MDKLRSQLKALDHLFLSDLKMALFVASYRGELAQSQKGLFPFGVRYPHEGERSAGLLYHELKGSLFQDGRAWP